MIKMARAPNHQCTSPQHNYLSSFCSYNGASPYGMQENNDHKKYGQIFHDKTVHMFCIKIKVAFIQSLSFLLSHFSRSLQEQMHCSKNFLDYYIIRFSSNRASISYPPKVDSTIRSLVSINNKFFHIRRSYLKLKTLQ